MNILIIVADDLGYGDVGYNGGSIETPAIDSLAASGLILNQFYGQSLCSPTRAAILTGRYPFHYGLQKVIWPWSDDGLSSEEKLLPQFFKEHNYDTYMVGKWNLGHNRNKYKPNQRGFDHYCGCYTGSVDYWNHKYFNVHDLVFNDNPIYTQGHMTDVLKDNAVKFLRTHDRNNNFFMYLTFTAPHLPLEPVESFLQKYSHIEDIAKRKYAALVDHLDSCIGQIVSTLKSLDMFNDTLIWLSADNGGNTNAGASNGKLRGGKIEYYEGGIRLVNLIHYKGFHGISNQVVHAIDIMPTLLSIANIPAPENIHGKDVSKLICGNYEDRTIIHHLVYGKDILDLGKLKHIYNDKDDEFVGAIRSGDWKLIKYEKQELFNIKCDPFETTDLSSKNNDKVQELTDIMIDNIHYYKQEPKRWINQNGYPDGYVFPEYWGQNLNIKHI